MPTSGERIKSLRKQKEWKQKELGDRLDVSPQVISNWERGYSYPNHRDIAELAHIFGTTADYLLCRVDDIFQESVDLSVVVSGNTNQPIERNRAEIIDLNKLFHSEYEISVDGKLLTDEERDMLRTLCLLFIGRFRAVKDQKQ